MSETAEELELLLPIAFVEGGALLSSIIGVILIIVAHGLARRIDGAFWIALAALLAGAATSLLHGLDYDRAVILLFAALVLWPCRREFHRTARLLQARFEAGWLALIFGVAASAAFLMFFSHKGAGYAHELWWQFAFDETAPRAMRAGLVASLAMTAGLVIFALRPRRLPPGLPDARDLADAARIIAAHGAPSANLALAGDKRLIFSPARDGFVMYGVEGRSWIALGDPVGPPETAAPLAWAFADAAAYAGARPVFHAVTDRHLPLWIDMGLTLHQLGEEALVDLTAFSMDDPARAPLRAEAARLQAAGLSFDLHSPPHGPALIAATTEVSRQWLAGEGVREKQFSVGPFDAGYLSRFPIALVRLHGRPVAFANVMTAGGAASIDLLRYGHEAPEGVTAFLLTALMTRQKAEGAQRFSLGMAPLSGLAEWRAESLWTRFGAQIYRHGAHFRNFEDLRRFKSAFDPDWRPRYLACATGLAPAGPLTDVSLLIAGERG
jgi:phosphatidylglycerol lysyltransferase